MPEEYYHIYNRGVDKRNIFNTVSDVQRFLQSIREFNVKDPIGSIYEHQFAKPPFGGKATKLVQFVAYCINPNHYHFILTPLIEKGVEKFMHKLGTGYARYFNEKNKRTGALFEGKFKSKHIDSNEYLLKASSYVNLNNRGKNAMVKYKLSASSWEEFMGKQKKFCNTSIILDQFRSVREYEKFALESWEDTCKHKGELKNMEFSED